MGTIRINGKTYIGENLTVKNRKVYINGTLVDREGDSKSISIVVEGNLTGSLSVESCDKIEIKGSCGSVNTASGNVSCGTVNGSIQTMSGDVMADDVHGNISTMSGDVKFKNKIG